MFLLVTDAQADIMILTEKQIFDFYKPQKLAEEKLAKLQQGSYLHSWLDQDQLNLESEHTTLTNNHLFMHSSSSVASSS